ncbi:MAG: hypothetical protein LBI79_02220 [Nitrososphaerota archaeon]|jgi:hypothetical protein|nr:hypothetical protein [Nitrososphaerota archaeon]
MNCQPLQNYPALTEKNNIHYATKNFTLVQNGGGEQTDESEMEIKTD